MQPKQTRPRRTFCAQVFKYLYPNRAKNLFLLRWSAQNSWVVLYLTAMGSAVSLISPGWRMCVSITSQQTNCSVCRLCGERSELGQVVPSLKPTENVVMVYCLLFSFIQFLILIFGLLIRTTYLVLWEVFFLLWSTAVAVDKVIFLKNSNLFQELWNLLLRCWCEPWLCVVQVLYVFMCLITPVCTLDPLYQLC